MLQDISNHIRTDMDSTLKNKRPWLSDEEREEEDKDDTSTRIDYKRLQISGPSSTLAFSSSSPPSSRGFEFESSSPPTSHRDTRYAEPFDAPTSPDAESKFTAFSSSSSAAASSSSLPPSSPTFIGVDFVEEEGCDDREVGSNASLCRVNASPNTTDEESREKNQSISKDVISQPSSVHVSTTTTTSIATPIYNLERGVVMQFGRKAKRTIEPRPETTYPIQLPKTAKHTSRMHCTLRILPRVGRPSAKNVVVEVKVLGMNGMKVDGGEVLKKGSVKTFKVPMGHEMKLCLWSWDGIVKVAANEEGSRKCGSKAKSMTTMKPNSPIPAAAAVRDGSFELASSPNGKVHDDRSTSPSPTSDISGQPSSPSRAAIEEESAMNEDDHEEGEEEKEEEEEVDLESARAFALVESLNLDLPGLIASAIVFSPRSTVDVDTVTRSLLKEVGSMWDVLEEEEGAKVDEEDEAEETLEERENRAVGAWWEVVERVLCEEPFFGCIDNAGLKDASGHPLQPAFFYMPDSDPSPSRVSALEPFVKRVRGARQRPAQYFWRKPSLRKNR